MKKVTFVCQHLGKGGAERVISILINNFVAIGWDVQLVMLFEEVIDYPISSNVSVICLNWNKMRSPFEVFPRLIKLRNIIKGDYVVSFLYVAIFYTVFSLLGCKKRVIVSERTDPARDPVGWIHKCLRNISYALANTVVFQTNEAKSYFSGKIYRDSVVIPNPISNCIPDRFYGERKKEIVAAGRLEKQKNFSLLIKAFSQFNVENPGYVLKIFGQGSEEADLLKLVKELEIDENVVFPGFVQNVDEQMCDAALYVSSSDYEGISNSMIEALAMGIPTICTDCPAGGAREMIKDGYNGILVPVGDVKKLVFAMKKILNNPAFALEISEHAVEIREELAEKKIIPMWINLME